MKKKFLMGFLMAISVTFGSFLARYALGMSSFNNRNCEIASRLLGNYNNDLLNMYGHSFGKALKLSGLNTQSKENVISTFHSDEFKEWPPSDLPEEINKKYQKDLIELLKSMGCDFNSL